MSRFHLHLVSDATGDTVHSVARACLSQFEEAEAIEHIWSMVRTKSQIERVLTGIEANPGVVLFTLVDETLRAQPRRRAIHLGPQRRRRRAGRRQPYVEDADLHLSRQSRAQGGERSLRSGRAVAARA